MLSLAAGAFGRVRAVSAPLQRLFFGIYSSRSRGAEKEKPAPITAPCLPDASAKPSQTWAALMKRVFEIDPLTLNLSRKCGAAGFSGKDIQPVAVPQQIEKRP